MIRMCSFDARNRGSTRLPTCGEKSRKLGGNGEWPGALLARRTEEGMEPDDLLCSRNARPEKALVGRAQWKISQPPSLERNEQAWREHLYRSMRAVEGSIGYSPQERFRELVEPISRCVVGKPPGPPRLARLARSACLAPLASKKLCAQ
jgi:hypothetical protein